MVRRLGDLRGRRRRIYRSFHLGFLREEGVSREEGPMIEFRSVMLFERIKLKHLNVPFLEDKDILTQSLRM